MKKTYHLCIDIEGVLGWHDEDLTRLFVDDDGFKRPPSYIRGWLKLQLAQGKKVLPFGKPCEGFSYDTGCLGHSGASGRAA